MPPSRRSVVPARRPHLPARASTDLFTVARAAAAGATSGTSSGRRDTEGVTDSLATVSRPAAHLRVAALLDTPTGHPIGIPTAFAALVAFFVLVFRSWCSWGTCATATAAAEPADARTPGPATGRGTSGHHPGQHRRGLQVDQHAHERQEHQAPAEHLAEDVALPAGHADRARPRWRGSAARSSCRARRRRSSPRPSAPGRARPALAAVTCRAPNSEFDDVSEPVTATPSQPEDRRQEREAPPAPAIQAPSVRGLARGVHDVRQGQDGHDRDDRRRAAGGRSSTYASQRLAPARCRRPGW